MPMKNHRGTAARHVRPHYFLSKQRQQRARNLPFPNRTAAAPDFDGACWFSTYAGSAVALNDIADHREDER